MVTEPSAGDRLLPVAERIARFIAAGEIDGAGLAVAVGGEPVFEWYGGQAAPGLPAGPAAAAAGTPAVPPCPPGG